jgi:uncharacterized protein (DUF488 family)
MPDCTLFTIGHSTRSFDDFVALLHAWRIALLADVRTAPHSRRNPQFNTEALAAGLPATGIAYMRLPELGGWRRPRAESPNTGWRHASFRGYADYMLTSAFEAAISNLIVLGREHRLAVMCAEAVPWRCHRSLIADALVTRGCAARHILSAMNADPHRMTPFAHIEDGLITYPPLPDAGVTASDAGPQKRPSDA